MNSKCGNSNRLHRLSASRLSGLIVIMRCVEIPGLNLSCNYLRELLFSVFFPTFFIPRSAWTTIYRYTHAISSNNWGSTFLSGDKSFPSVYNAYAVAELTHDRILETLSHVRLKFQSCAYFSQRRSNQAISSLRPSSFAFPL